MASSHGVKNHAMCVQPASLAPIHGMRQTFLFGNLQGQSFAQDHPQQIRYQNRTVKLAAPRAACFISKSGLDVGPRLRQRSQQLKLKELLIQTLSEKAAKPKVWCRVASAHVEMMRPFDIGQ
jgi:hypothetical protein